MTAPLTFECDIHFRRRECLQETNQKPAVSFTEHQASAAIGNAFEQRKAPAFHRPAKSRPFQPPEIWSYAVEAHRERSTQKGTADSRTRSASTRCVSGVILPRLLWRTINANAARATDRQVSASPEPACKIGMASDDPITTAATPL